MVIFIYLYVFQPNTVRSLQFNKEQAKLPICSKMQHISNALISSATSVVWLCGVFLWLNKIVWRAQCDECGTGRQWIQVACQCAVCKLGYHTIESLLRQRTWRGHCVPEEFLHLTFFGVVGDLVGEASGSPSSLWVWSLSLSSRTERSASRQKHTDYSEYKTSTWILGTFNQNGCCQPTLFAHGRFLRLVLLVLSLVGDFARDRAGHVEFIDVQGGLAERGHGRVHACIAVWGTTEGSQVKSFAPGDDGDVEGELAPAIWGWVLGDGERRRGGELPAGPGGAGRLSIQEFTVLTAGKE